MTLIFHVLPHLAIHFLLCIQFFTIDNYGIFLVNKISALIGSPLVHRTFASLFCDVELLRGITAKFRDRFQEARSMLTAEIQQDYKRNTRRAAFDFVLRNGAATPFAGPSSTVRSASQNASLNSSSAAVAVAARSDQRQRLFHHSRRVLAKKLCYQHYFGKRMIDFWHKHIRWASLVSPPPPPPPWT